MISKETQARIDEAKANGCTVMSVPINGEQFIYRSFNRLEWRGIQKQINELAPKDPNASQVGIKELGEELIVRCGLIEPVLDNTGILSLGAGRVSQLAELMLVASGFGGLEAEPVKL